MKTLLTSLLISSCILVLQAQDNINLVLKLDSLQKVDNAEESISILERLSAQNPYHGSYYYALGKAYYSIAKYRESSAALLKAQDLGIHYRSNYYLACNFVHIDKPDSALVFLQRHLITPLNGDNPYGKDVLEDSMFSSLHTLPDFKTQQTKHTDPGSDRNERWAADIEYLSNVLKETHYDPFFKVDEQEWDETVKKIIKRIPSSNDDQILVYIRQFLAKVGDGHTRILDIPADLDQSKELPLITNLFSDGCYIVGATEEYKNLLGAKIINVNDIAFDNIFTAVSTTIPIDNEMGYRSQFDYHFRNMNLLHGLEIAKSREEINMQVSLEGEIVNARIKSVDKEDESEYIRYHNFYDTKYPIFLENYHKGNIKWYWFSYLKEPRIMYVQINGIMNNEDVPLSEFCNSIKAFVDTSDFSAFVLDIRNNGGGNTDLNKYILSMLLSDKVNIMGKLFTIIGPKTFSAAQNLTTVIENYTETIFIGEPTGSRPNFIGEVNPIVLPHSKIKISSSNVYHQHGYSSDQRKWIPPDIWVEFSSEDYKKGNDPVLQEIIDYVESR